MMDDLFMTLYRRNSVHYIVSQLIKDPLAYHTSLLTTELPPEGLLTMGELRDFERDTVQGASELEGQDDLQHLK